MANAGEDSPILPFLLNPMGDASCRMLAKFICVIMSEASRGMPCLVFHPSPVRKIHVFPNFCVPLGFLLGDL
jgi:hypothetical protein